MSRTKKIIWIVVALIIAVGAFWWTTIKKRVVRNAVTKAVQKKTDSLYRITYDTSEIDEVNGDVYLRNVRIGIDSAQWVRLVRVDSMPPVTMSVSIGRITIKGLKELKLLSNSSLDVSSIELEKPVLRLDKWKRKNPGEEKLNDTLEIYQRLVGNFDFLRAKSIRVIDGQFTLIDNTRKEVLSAHGIDIDIDDFLVDSAHNYQNVLSYFVKQTRATIRGINGSMARTGKLVYDSRQQRVRVDSLTIMGTVPAQCRWVEISGLSTDMFVYAGLINARKVLVREPRIVIRPAKKKKAESASSLPGGLVDSLVVDKGDLTLYSKSGQPTVIRSIDLTLRHVKSVNGRVAIEDYLDPSSLGFSIASVRVPMGLHNMDLRNLSYPGTANGLSIQRMHMQPAITRKQLKEKIGKQTDLYTITATDIRAERFDLRRLFKDNAIDIQKVSMQLDLHVLDDKTLPVDSVKKGRGRFPYEAITQSKMPIDIRSFEVRHSRIAYEEDAPKTNMTGTIFFTDVNGVATNITNIPSRLAKDNVMKIEAGAKVMGAGQLQSQWSIPLNIPDVPFRVTGSVAPFPITALSQPFERLSLTRIRSGQADRIRFEIDGNRAGSKGTMLLNYHDLKVEMLRKNDDDSLERKGFLTFIANADIKNGNNASSPKTFTYKRDRYKSFFNLLWKSIFEGGKKTILIVH